MMKICAGFKMKFFKTRKILLSHEGTGGLQKRRFAFKQRGKSGNLRICYVDFLVYEKIFLITAFAKGEKTNLTKAEKNQIRQVIVAIEKEQGGIENVRSI